MLAPRIQKTPLQHRRKPDPAHAPEHRVLIKQCPCVACGKPPPSDPHHLRGAFLDGRPTGMGRRDDRYQIPLCRPCHDATHADGDLEGWLAGLGIDGRALAQALWSKTGDLDAMTRIVARAKQVRAVGGTVVRDEP